MIQGIYASNQGIIGERAGDFASAVLQTNPSGTALMLALSSGMEDEPARDTIFHWYEDVHQAGRRNIASGGTTTAIVVDEGSTFKPGSTGLVEETGEIILVTAVATNSLTVLRGLGGTAVVSVTNVMHLQLIGNAYEEGSGIPVAITQQGTTRSNLTQIFRDSWAVTGTAKAVDFRTGNKVAKNKADCYMYHAENIERSIMWGVKHASTINNKPFRMTDGIEAQIKQYGGINDTANVGGVPGNYNLKQFNDFLRRVYSKNVKGRPQERIALGGDLVLQNLNNMALLDSVYNITKSETTIGIEVTTIQTVFGKLKLMTHPLMNENPVWQKRLYVLHPAGIKRRTLRPTFKEDYDKNGNRIQGIDGDQGVVTTEMGIEVSAAQTMGILDNVSNAVAST